MAGKAWPLRPELVESAFMLWSHTGDPRYKHLGEGTLTQLLQQCRCRCGHCAIRDIETGAPRFVCRNARHSPAPRVFAWMLVLHDELDCTCWQHLAYQARHLATAAN